MIRLTTLITCLLFCYSSFSQTFDPEKQPSEMTSEERNAFFIELANRRNLPGNDYYYSLILEVYDAGLSDETILESLHRYNYPVFYFLLKNGYEPPLTHINEAGETEKLINHKALDYYDYSRVIIYELMEMGHKADLHTLENLRFDELLTFTVLLHPENKQWVKNNTAEILQYLQKHSEQGKPFVPIPAARQYEQDLNALISQIIDGDNDAIKATLTRVLNFLEILEKDQTLSVNSSQRRHGNQYHFSEELFHLVNLALIYNRVEFFKVLNQRQLVLPGDNMLGILNITGGKEAIDFIIANWFSGKNPFENTQKEKPLIRNPNLYQSLIEHEIVNPDDIEFDFTINYLISGQVNGPDFLRFYIPLAQKYKIQEKDDTNSDKVEAEELHYNTALSIINGEVEAVEQFMNSQYNIFTSGIEGISFLELMLAFGNQDIIDLVARCVVNETASQSINEDQAFLLGMNHQNIPLKSFWDDLNLANRKDVLAEAAFLTGDKDMLKYLIKKGFNIAELEKAEIEGAALFRPESDDFIRFIMEQGINPDFRMYYLPSQSYHGFPYRFIPSEDPFESVLAIKSERPFFHWIMAFGSDDLLISFIELQQKKQSGDALTEMNSHLFLRAVEYNRPALAEKLMQEKLMQEGLMQEGLMDNANSPEFSEMLHTVLKEGSEEVLNIVFRNGVFANKENREIIKMVFYQNSFDFSPLALWFLNDRFDSFSHHLKALEYEVLLTAGHSKLIKESFYQLRDLYPDHLFEMAVNINNEYLARYIFDNHRSLVDTKTGEIYKYISSAFFHKWYWLTDYLIEQNTAVYDYTSSGGRTLLHSAVSSQESELIEYLLENDFDPNVPDGYGQTAYELFSLKKDNFQNATQLDILFKENMAALDNPEKIQSEQMRNAIKSNNINEVKKLLKNGVDPNGVIVTTHRGTEISESFINHAARYGYDVICFYLLLHGADVNCTAQPLGLSPLAVAIIENNYEIARTLLYYGADTRFVMSDEARNTLRLYDTEITIEDYISQRGIKSEIYMGEEDDKTDSVASFLNDALKSDSPKTLLSFTDEHHSAKQLFSTDIHKDSKYIEQIFREKSFSYISELFKKGKLLPEPGTLVYLAARQKRQGLVDLLTSMNLPERELYQEHVPYYKFNIYEYNIAKLLEFYTNNNSLHNKQKFKTDTTYAPLSGEVKKALKYAMTMHSAQPESADEVMWNYSRALKHNSPEAFLLMLDNDAAAGNDVKQVFRSIFEGNKNEMEALVTPDGMEPGFMWREISLLTWAAFNNQTEIATWLIDQDVEFSHRHYRNRIDMLEPEWEIWKVPVFWAVLHDNMELTNKLIEAGEDFKNLYLDDVEHGYFSVFDFSFSNEKTTVLSHLLDEGFIDYTYGNNLYNLLNKAIYFDNVAFSLKLLEMVEKSTRSEEDSYRSAYTAIDEETSIRYAVYCRSTQVLNAFREKLPAFNTVFLTPDMLNLATRIGNIDMAVEILSGIPDLNKEMFKNNTFVRALFRNATPALYNAFESRGWRAADILSELHNPISYIEVIMENPHNRKLVDAFYQSDINTSVSQEKRTNMVLQTAIKKGNIELAIDLMDNGVSWHKRDGSPPQSFLLHAGKHSNWKLLMDAVVENEKGRIPE